MRPLVLAAALLSALAVTGSAQAYGWPIKPFDQPHAIRGYYDDPRVDYARGEHSISFHFGVDISAPDGTPVYAVATGTAFPRKYSIAVGTPEGREFGYWHVIPAVKHGAWVSLHELIGWVEPGQGHVHLAESYDGVYTNPLRRGGLAPYFDNTTPVISSVEIDSGGLHVDLAHVAGVVNLITEAYDTPPIAPPPPYAHTRVAPAYIRWRLIGATGWRTAVDFRHELLPQWLFWTVYAPGTVQNRPFRPGRYRFYLLRGFDTREYQNGYYRLEVRVSDTRGNVTTSVLPFRIDNL